MADRLKRVPLFACKTCGESAIVTLLGGNHMATKNKLKDTAVKIGSAVGRADASAHNAVKKAARAADVAKQELNELSKQVEALKKQLKKSTKRLKSALK